MEAKFIGDPANNFDGPQTVEVQGVAFPRDKWVTVKADSPLARKLPGNSHFETRQGKADKSAAQKVENPAAPKADDLEKMTKAELQQRLDDEGVEYEGGANKDALVDALRAHLNDAGSPGQ